MPNIQYFGISGNNITGGTPGFLVHFFPPYRPWAPGSLNVFGTTLCGPPSTALLAACAACGGCCHFSTPSPPPAVGGFGGGGWGGGWWGGLVSSPPPPPSSPPPSPPPPLPPAPPPPSPGSCPPYPPIPTSFGPPLSVACPDVRHRLRLASDSGVGPRLDRRLCRRSHPLRLCRLQYPRAEWRHAGRRRRLPL